MCFGVLTNSSQVYACSPGLEILRRKRSYSSAFGDYKKEPRRPTTSLEAGLKGKNATTTFICYDADSLRIP